MTGETDAMVQRFEVGSTSADEVRAIMTAGFAAGLIVKQAGTAPLEFEQTGATDGIVTVSTLRFSGHVRAAMDRSRDVLFTDIAVGRYDWRSREQRGNHIRPLILPTDQPLAVDFESVRSVMVSIDTKAVERWLSRFGGLPPSPALLHRAEAGSDAVRNAVRFYGQTMPSPSFDSKLVRAGMLDVLLSITAHHLLPDARPAQPRSAPAALLRAEDHMREHAADPLSIAEVAEASRLSIRGLQDQFRRWRGTTPAEYLRTVRLERVHADLVSAWRDDRPETVAAVARRWGFAHLGRFAQTYAAAFDELPSATLRFGPKRSGT